MAVPTYTVTCTRKTLLATGVYELVCTKPEGFIFKPGQFVLFDVPMLENPTDIQTRAFSIASTPAEGELLFVFKLIPGGRASKWVEHTVTEGTQIIMKGPFGNFTLDPAPEKELVCIATSTGIAPFRSQLLDALERGDLRKMDLIFGVRSEADLFWNKELEQIAEKHPNFFLHFALSQPSDAWKGHKGRVQTLVPLIVKDFTPKLIYACGSPVMTKEIKEMALGQWGMEKKMVHVEGYI